MLLVLAAVVYLVAIASGQMIQICQYSSNSCNGPSVCTSYPANNCGMIFGWRSKLGCIGNNVVAYSYYNDYSDCENDYYQDGHVTLSTNCGVDGFIPGAVMFCGSVDLLDNITKSNLQNPDRSIDQVVEKAQIAADHHYRKHKFKFNHASVSTSDQNNQNDDGAAAAAGKNSIIDEKNANSKDSNGNNALVLVTEEMTVVSAASNSFIKICSYSGFGCTGEATCVNYDATDNCGYIYSNGDVPYFAKLNCDSYGNILIYHFLSPYCDVNTISSSFVLSFENRCGADGFMPNHILTCQSSSSGSNGNSETDVGTIIGTLFGGIAAGMMIAGIYVWKKSRDANMETQGLLQRA